MLHVSVILVALLIASFGSTVEAGPEQGITSENQRTKNPDNFTAGETAKQPAHLCEGGKVLQNDHDSLLVRDSSKKELRLKLDSLTQIGQADPKNATFIEGDRIEAMVTPDGRAWSVTLLKHQSNQPGVDAEGD